MDPDPPVGPVPLQPGAECVPASRFACASGPVEFLIQVTECRQFPRGADKDALHASAPQRISQHGGGRR